MITKSDYLLYKQCEKSFWLQKNKQEVLDVSKNEALLDKGNEVTEEARKLFPNGTLISYTPDAKQMIQRTRELIKNGVTTIYEAAFEYEGCYVICDILHKNQEAWSIYEVKSSTGVKQRHLDDLTFQFYVVANQLPIESVSLVHINNEYIRTGELDEHQLFRIDDQTEYILGNIHTIPLSVEEMKRVMEGKEPMKTIGEYCNKYEKDAFECAAKDYCWANIPDYSVFNISRIGKKAFELHEKGIVALDDVPDTYKLSEAQRFQVDAYKENRLHIDKKQIRDFLKAFTHPLYFLDFETFQQAIPRFQRLKPYEQIPFQYSLHIQEFKGAEFTHKEFLAKEGEDPRRHLAEKLVSDVPKGVTSVAYNMSFEKMVLRQLASIFPDLAEHLLDIHDHMVDLMVPFQKKWYYTNDMKGSYSIKYVLPALLPNDPTLDYKELSVQNGTMAMNLYERLHTLEREKIEEVRQGLLAYCRLDTWGMVKIWQVLDQLEKD